ncbi:MAG: N-acetylmuramoyl-L-alanine amidase [Armatimonadetes bacterium]|nr:N-acetylmuramoyl-L-alanine amidase [Armatimonadota bacterium]
MEAGPEMKVALDAGHGGRTGAMANGLIEDELALDFVKRIGHHLRASGHQTVCTRADEKFVPLQARGRLAVAEDCDAFLSIHFNAGPASARGVEAFIALGDNRSRTLAERLVDAASSLGLKTRGVKWDSQSQHTRLKVLRDTYRVMPAVLLEVAFLTSAHDSRLLKGPEFREAVAKKIAETLTSPQPSQGIVQK